ncbi:transglutaminase-like domain-containing protein [Patescibacteria group bacterium]|nr:transglutaminase-like domain-containing protein [Patescibacteria group bacterium]
MKKFILIFLLFLVNPISALSTNNEFNTTQKISYSIDLKGDAKVSHQISITNNFSNIYPKEYLLEIFDQNIENIKGSDQGGNIIQSTEKIQEKSTIKIKFNNPIPGKDKKTDFNISYTIPNLAQQKGQLWEINLPQQNETNSQISLKIPDDFGNLVFCSVKNEIKQQKNYKEIFFNNKQKQKITMAFGNTQIFDFELNFFLENKAQDNIRTSIPIPPDTNTQNIIITKIDPSPENIVADLDGNWLAEYQLNSNTQKEIIVTGQAEIHPIDYSFDIPPDFQKLTVEQKFWPVNDPNIQKINSNLHSAKDIYQYVVNTLDYDYQQIDQAKRKGALTALINPANSLCTEFTDLFITLARNKTIPAQEIEGYAFTNKPELKPVNINTDILHAWPQFWDKEKNAWITIDPTWEKTTEGIDYFSNTDLNHIVFVIHGHNSQYPAPPGSYKKTTQQKSIKVNFANNHIHLENTDPIIFLSKSKQASAQSAFGGTKVIIQNNNSSSTKNIDLSIKKQNWTQKIDIMPPFSRLEFNLPKINPILSLLPKNKNLEFTLNIQGQEKQTQIVPYPQHHQNTTSFVIIIIGLLTLGGIILVKQKK